MTPFRQPLFRTVRADGATCSLTFANDGSWMILLDEQVAETGRSSAGGVEEAVDRFRALSTNAPPWTLPRMRQRHRQVG